MVPISSIAVFATMTGIAGAFGAAAAKEDRDFTVQFLLIVLVVVAVSFSPRIPFDLGLLGQRRLDIRIEDLLLVVVLLSVIFDRSGLYSRIRLNSCFSVLFAYLTASGVTTLVGIALLELPMFRGIFYFLKEVEFILMAVSIANIIRTRKQLYVFTVVFIGCALVNASWAGYQLLVDSTGPLFQTIEQSGYYGRPVGASGTALIGEPSRLSSGGYYLAPLFLTCGWLFAERNRNRALWWGVAGFGIGIAIVASLSRVSAFSAIVALACMALVDDRVPNSWLIAIPGVGLVGMIAVSPFLPVGRFRPSSVLKSISTRFEKWDPIVASLDITSFFGAGKGGLVPVSGVEEAHNFYLRVFVEAGLLGILLFIIALLTIVRTAYAVYRRSTDSVVMAVGVAAICATLSVSTAALFQDAFINVKLAESYWILIGALGATVKLTD